MVDAMQLQILSPAVVAAHGAACLDGSPPAMYYAPANTTDDPSAATRWVLYFKGGGWCYNETLCAARAKGELGSSTDLPPTSSDYGHGFLSPEREENTVFYNAHRVLLWYCDGASFAGNREGTVAVGNQTLYFRGLHNLRATVAELTASYGLDKAKEVLLSGGSAGGLAAFLHADYVRTLLPATVQRYKVRREDSHDEHVESHSRMI